MVIQTSSFLHMIIGKAISGCKQFVCNRHPTNTKKILTCKLLVFVFFLAFRADFFRWLLVDRAESLPVTITEK